MNPITRRFALKNLLFFCLLFAVGLQDSLALIKEDNALNYIFKAGDDGYACFRIPAILTTKNNTLLAFAEGRKKDCGDSGDIDLVLKRSSDGGRTWGRLQVVWSDSVNTCGNPVPILDRSSGRIILISTWNLGVDHEKQIMDGSSKDGRHVYVLSSDNQGESWSKPKEITSSVKMNNWTWYATGPCHGLQISEGVHKGRLVVPVNHVEAPSNQNFSHTIYSDDHGETWSLGKNTPQEMMNETTVAEISGGKLMLNMRNANRSIRTRNSSISSDGGVSWSDVKNDSTLIEPICQGSLFGYANSSNRILFFINPASKTKRINLTLRTSFDDGMSWANAKVIHSGPSAYSDIAIFKNKYMTILYESGNEKPYEGIAFKRMTLKELMRP